MSAASNIEKALAKEVEALKARVRELEDENTTLDREASELTRKCDELEDKLTDERERNVLEEATNCRRCDQVRVLTPEGYCSRECELGMVPLPYQTREAQDDLLRTRGLL